MRHNQQSLKKIHILNIIMFSRAVKFDRQINWHIEQICICLLNFHKEKQSSIINYRKDSNIFLQRDFPDDFDMQVQSCVGAIPCRFNPMRVQSPAGSIPCRFNPVRVQSGAGSIRCGLNPLRVQTCGFNSVGSIPVGSIPLGSIQVGSIPLEPIHSSVKVKIKKNVVICICHKGFFT